MGFGNGIKGFDVMVITVTDDLYVRLDEVGKAAVRWRILCGEPLVFSSKWFEERRKMTKEEVRELWIGDVVESVFRGVQFVVSERTKDVFVLNAISERGTVTKRSYKRDEKQMMHDFKLVSKEKV